MLERIRDALLTVGVPVYHFHAQKQPDQYIVWAEDGQAGLAGGDNKGLTQVIDGTIDYFTRVEYDKNFIGIEAALNSADVAWLLSSIQYEDDTRYIHYEWVFQGVIGVG